MRNFVAITLFLTFIITTALGLTTEIKRAQETATYGLTQDMTVFTWSRDVPVQDPSATERILTTAADENNVNLVRRTVRQSDGNGLDLTYYIRLNHPTKMFERARLAGGSTLTNSETQGTGTVLSSKPGATKEAPQSLANSYDLTFRPLEDMFANLPAIGVYKAETADRRDFKGFLESISRQVNEEILEVDPDAALTTPATFVEDTEDAVDAEPLSTTPLLVLSGGLAALVIVATIGALARDAAVLGVQRLHGYSLMRAWWSRLGLRGVMSTGAAALLCVAVLPWIPGMDITIAVRVLAVPLISTTVLTAAASLSGVIIVSQVRVSDLVKKRFA
ncbi:hypothetical protein [Brevibacterium sp. CFH 10365]|uniref:hypothetical protein n=1 Tax=Brevibacterium sp. CFH 10365 TaxID=2585207 RepID=UPI001266788D|nr:hypothetical protein [Brevibacterium sp. CFH 10365]